MYQVPTYGSVTTTPLWTDFLATSNDLINIAFVEIVKSDSAEDAEVRFEAFVDEWMRAGGAEAQEQMSDKLIEIYGE